MLIFFFIQDNLQIKWFIMRPNSRFKSALNWSRVFDWFKPGLKIIKFGQWSQNFWIVNFDIKQALPTKRYYILIRPWASPRPWSVQASPRPWSVKASPRPWSANNQTFQVFPEIIIFLDEKSRLMTYWIPFKYTKSHLQIFKYIARFVFFFLIILSHIFFTIWNLLVNFFLSSKKSEFWPPFSCGHQMSSTKCMYQFSYFEVYWLQTNTQT